MEADKIKKIYNNIAKEKREGEYEYRRWFKTPLLMAGYEMEKKSIEYHLLKSDKLKFKDYLELGPGAGTWTKIFLEKYKEANFDLIDISEEMLKAAKKSLSQFGNIRFFNEDFIKFDSDKKYDFFFSSRAIEYIKDKEKAIEKLENLLVSGGGGFIITKNPRYFISRILGRKIPELHKGQISPNLLKGLLDKFGFKDIEIYPVAMVFPVVKSPLLNKMLYKFFYRCQLNFLSGFFAESYCVKFSKK